MKVLVVGSGGREHALVWKIAQSPRVSEVWCAPGNSGIGQTAELSHLKANNLPGLAALAAELKIDLTVAGPEEPLSLGIVDYFRREGLRIFGPDKHAAELESSKVFAKGLMKKYNIPTADFAEFDDPQEALSYLKNLQPPVVVKADGLAAGKGVIIAHSRQEAEAAVRSIMIDRAFGLAGRRLIFEEFLEGPETTIMAFAAGTDFCVMPPSQDHKPIFDGDKGPNTGGMGCYSPVPMVTAELQREAAEKVIAPTLQAMADEDRPYFGILYAGLILTKEGLKVLEFNCRFGDPETQVILPLLENDLMDIIEPMAHGGMGEVPRWSSRAAACVVMASGGYPGEYEKGKIISGIEEAGRLEDVLIFHAATWKAKEGWQTNGGRVLGVTGLGVNLQAAVQRAYEAVEKITWEGVHYRRDIAAKALTAFGK
jgi:phosphoribosylamine--glycine ligase